MSPTNKSVTITATVSIMATVSNPRSVLARITKPDGTVVDLFKSTSTTYTVTSNGTYTFEVDCGITRSVTINNIDKEPPAAPVINVKGNQLTIAAGKDDGSGVKETDYQLNNGEWTRYTAPVTLPDGNYTINAKTIDNADNTSVIATTNVTIVTKAVGISLNKITSNLIVGQADNLTAVVTPDNAANKTVKWTSSDSSIASVDENGKVTALKAGTVKITASTTDGSNLTASCDVTVKAANRIDLSKSTDNLTVGQTDKLKAVVTSDNENKTVKWMSSDPSVVTVDEDGTITAVKAGNAVIEAVAQDGSNMVASYAVKVEDATKKLILNMTNSTIRQYKLSETEFNDFLTWYSNMVQEGTGTPYYIFNVPANGSIPASKEYVFYKNIESFKEEDL